MADSAEWTPPSGFEPYVSPSPYVVQLGVMYRRESTPECSVLALRLQPMHTNLHGMAHGGMLATLVDAAIGHSGSRAMGRPVVSVQLSVDYLKPGRLNDWIEAHVNITKTGRQLGFVRCELKRGTAILVQATGILSARP